MAIGKLSSSPPTDCGQQDGRSNAFTLTPHGALPDWWEREREREELHRHWAGWDLFLQELTMIV